MDRVIDACRAALARGGGVIALTGAGISAESGIPTFRGREGYWTVGAEEYHAQELATAATFEIMPWEVWAWYLYRRATCRQAVPNPGHLALVRLDAALTDRFSLITQNIDGLHRRAGSPDARTYPIHGDIDLMRCAARCCTDRWPIPDAAPLLTRGAPVPDAARALLVCPRCGGPARPDVLWFDETYEEPYSFAQTVRRRAEQASLIVVVGTSASTNLPWHVVMLGLRAGATIVDVNLEDNPFGEIAASSGGVLREPAATALPRLVDAIT